MHREEKGPRELLEEGTVLEGEDNASLGFARPVPGTGFGSQQLLGPVY